MKEKTKDILFTVFVIFLMLAIFIGACLCVWEGLCIFYDAWKANTEGKYELTAAADAPYFKNGKRRQRHWKNNTYEYAAAAQVGDIIDPGGNLLSGKDSMVIIGIHDPLIGRREYTQVPLKLMMNLTRNNQNQQAVMMYLKKEKQAKESPRLKEPAGKEAQ